MIRMTYVIIKSSSLRALRQAGAWKQPKITATRCVDIAIGDNHGLLTERDRLEYPRHDPKFFKPVWPEIHRWQPVLSLKSPSILNIIYISNEIWIVSPRSIGENLTRSAEPYFKNESFAWNFRAKRWSLSFTFREQENILRAYSENRTQ